ncbi:MAG: class IV adenylate cyclase [Bdellovibrionales bacterium]
MQTEIEAKFLNIDRDAMRVRLSEEGFVCVKPDFMMRRIAFDVPGTDFNTWARVRDEGDRITISFKRTHDQNNVTGTEEIEVTVNDFEQGVRLLVACGLIRKGYQETRREVWQRGDVEVTLDEWPCIPPFTEIEGPSESAVRGAAIELGFDWKDALFGAVGAVYEHIGISAAEINKFPLLTFENAENVMKLAKKKA